ncbi:MAG TPA: helix-turn-helix transcriptional regulator, partial [Streptosporangiaceae bacterium]
MTHPRNAPPDRTTTAGAGAEEAAFLRDLRALRDQAGLGPRDLASRAHFPEDTLVTAEAGPGLPSLPVLQAYVRGCGAGESEWEDRWRRLNSESASGSTGLPTRAPAANRPPARVMPFPEPGAGRGPTEQDAIGFGLARVARGLAPLSSGPRLTPPETGTGTPFGGELAGNTGTDRSAQFSGSGNGSAELGGWFDPAPAAPSDPAPTPPAASPGAPTVRYPAAAEYAPAPEQPYGPSAPASAPPPSYRLPEEFLAPVPKPEEFRAPASEPLVPAGHGFG